MTSFIGPILVFYIGFKIGNSIRRTDFIRFITAFSFIVLFYKFAFSVQFFLLAFLTFSLISVSVIDFFHRIIPVMFPIILVIVGVIFSFFNGVLGKTNLSRFLNSFSGVLIGGGILIITGFLGHLIYKKEVIGGGDVELMAGVGAFIGWEKVLFAVFIAALFGSITALLLIVCKKIKMKDYIPFGPFLSVGSFITIFLPRPLLILNMFFIWETQLLNKFCGT
ncbi:MAG: A24 family peptidase [Endomicrobium sp.]|jgi:leader peptidase (prepilin peptidase)/N-methyltransferase|nr:A24 family peptidase [Endomicrobium sp.]